MIAFCRALSATKRRTALCFAFLYQAQYLCNFQSLESARNAIKCRIMTDSCSSSLLTTCDYILFFSIDVGGGDSCLLLFLLCLVTVVISIGGTALYCALGDAQSSVCQDFSRNADFYIGQIRRGITRLQHWYTSGF